MMSALLAWAALLLAVADAYAETVPGMRLTKITATDGFVTSLAIDSQKRLWYSTTDGGIYRIGGSGSILLTRVETRTAETQRFWASPFEAMTRSSRIM